MHYRRLGKTGLQVSEIGFGAEWIGGWPQERVDEMVRACEAAGVNIVDCWMADPAIRGALGAAIEPNRGHWIIQGHIGSTWQNGQYTRTREMGPVRQAFDEQLRLLRTDHVELGMIHYVDALDEFRRIMRGEFFQYVQELLAAGRIRHIGLSTHNPNVALEAVTHPEIEMIMFSVNPVFDLMPAVEDDDILFAQKIDDTLAGMDPVRAELYAACERADVGITCMKPFAGGRLLDAGKSPFGVAMTSAQCIEYCLNRPAVASVLGGYAKMSDLQDALAYYDATPEQLNYADTLAQAPQHAYYGKCIYCGHCQPCVVGINIAQTNKFYDLAVMQDEVPESVREHYAAMDAKAGDCIGCQSCEPNCPFGVKIAEQMEKTSALFGC